MITNEQLVKLKEVSNKNNLGLNIISFSGSGGLKGYSKCKYLCFESGKYQKVLKVKKYPWLWNAKTTTMLGFQEIFYFEDLHISDEQEKLIKS